MQACSQANLEYQGPRWRTWMYHVAVYFPELKKYIPKKYHKEIDLERKIYNHKMKIYDEKIQTFRLLYLHQQRAVQG